MEEKANMATRYEHEIPEGYEARIEDNKIILKKKKIESKNELMRKELLAFAELHIYDFKKYKYSSDEKVQQIISWWRNIIAYLKKQKEQKPTAEEVLIMAGLKPFKDGNQWCILAGNNIQEGICGFGNTIEDALYEFLKDICEHQKHAEWGEEDEAAFGDLMWCIKQARKFAKNQSDMGDIWFAEHWVKNRLKSLCPQPKQELSEEDEKKLHKVITIIERNTIGNQNTIDWLKSLRPQPHWKPSEEQMKALLSKLPVVKGSGDKVQDILESLYNDLKKL